MMIMIIIMMMMMMIMKMMIGRCQLGRQFVDEHRLIVKLDAAVDETRAKLGARINELEHFASHLGQRLHEVDGRQVEEIVEAIFLVGAIKVDLNGKLELAIAVLFYAKRRVIEHAHWILECLVKTHDHLLHQLVQVDALDARSNKKIPFVSIAVQIWLWYS